MAQATITATTSKVDLVKAWRYVAMGVFPGIRFSCEEYDMVDALTEVKVDWSARQTYFSLEINEKVGAASLAEGGWKARPSSVALEEAIVDLQHFNTSFTNTEIAKWADAGMENQVIEQLKLQGKQAVDAMGRHIADYFHGTSVGTLALTDTDISGTTGTLTLHSGYGNTAITSAAYIADKFRVGEYIALVDGSTLVTNGIGVITAVTAATPSIAVTFIGSVTATNNNLKVVKANSMENESLAGTDYNKGLVGWEDIENTASVHSLSSGTVADWSVARNNTAGGRYNGIKLRNQRDAIENRGPSDAKPDTLMIAQGVRRDAIAYERAGLRFNDNAFGLEIDGDIKAKGLKIVSSRRVKPGVARLYASKKLRKISLLPQPEGNGGFGWDDAEKLENRSVYRFDTDYVTGTVVLARKSFAVDSGLTEQ